MSLHTCRNSQTANNKYKSSPYSDGDVNHLLFECSNNADKTCMK